MTKLPINKIDNTNVISINYFKDNNKSDIVCILCEGFHANNTFCQANDSWIEEGSYAS